MCTDYITFHNEIEYLKPIWQRSYFALFFIDNCVKKILDKLLVTHKSSNTVSNKKSLPGRNTWGKFYVNVYQA